MPKKIKEKGLIINATAYFACNAKAHKPAAKGALALVPVCISVQPFRRSVVT